jgi:general secretion pathway protein L
MKLRIFLPSTERPAPDERCAWKLFDPRGELRRSGEDEPASMPRAKEVELVLPAERVLFARLRLPKVNAATIRQLLPYAVEDRLLADPAHIHAVAGETNEHGETVVAVVDREWLRARIDVLSAEGHEATAAFCESALLAGGRGDWHVVWGRARGMLVDDEGVGASFDRGPGLPLALRVALDEATERGDKPTSVRVHVEDGEALPDLNAWSSETGVVFTSGTQWDTLAAGQPASHSINLLQGDLSRRTRGAGPRIPRAALWLGGAIVTLQVALAVADNLRMQAERDRLVQRQEQVFRAAFPEAKAVVDPELQMSRQLEELKRSRGLAAGDDFLAQLTRASREARAVRSVEYAGGRMVTR